MTKKVKSKSRSHHSKKVTEKHRPRPRQGSLPGMEQRGIPELESAAENYVNVRDRRMRLTEEEVEAKSQVLFLMHKHERQNYRHDDFLIMVIPGEENVKVKVVEDSQVVSQEGGDVGKKKVKKAAKTVKKHPSRPPEVEPAETQQEAEPLELDPEDEQVASAAE